MDPRTRDDRSKPGDAKTPGVSDRRSSVATFVLLFLAMALVLDGVAGERGWLANRQGERQLEQAERERDVIRQNNARLRDEARRLREQDPDTVEAIARRELGFIRPGEKVVTVRAVPKSTK
jgi:cell division protein FtsB